MEPGVDRKREHGEGSPTYKLGCSARIVGLKNESLLVLLLAMGFKRRCGECSPYFSASLLSPFQSVQLIHPQYLTWNLRKKCGSNFQGETEKTQTKTQLQRSPFVQVPHFPTPFPPQPDWSTLADSCWSSTPHTSKVKSKSSKPKIAYPKWEREVFPKDMNITILWDLDISNEQIQRKHWTKKRKHPNVHIP